MKLKFSLRTTFVLVTLVCIGLAWSARSLQLIERRREALKDSAVYGDQTVRPLLDRPIAPAGLWIFGERGQGALRLNTSSLSKEEVAEIRRLFPESRLMLRRSLFRQEGDVDLEPGQDP